MIAKLQDSLIVWDLKRVSILGIRIEPNRMKHLAELNQFRVLQTDFLKLVGWMVYLAHPYPVIHALTHTYTYIPFVDEQTMLFVSPFLSYMWQHHTSFDRDEIALEHVKCSRHTTIHDITIILVLARARIVPYPEKLEWRTARLPNIRIHTYP